MRTQISALAARIKGQDVGSGQLGSLNGVIDGLTGAAKTNGVTITPRTPPSAAIGGEAPPDGEGRPEACGGEWSSRRDPPPRGPPLRRLLLVVIIVLALVPLTASGAPSGYRAQRLAAPPAGPVLPATPRAQPLIIGGAPVSAYPWTALLTLSANGAPYGECTGSLIGDRWVLTAAHCVTDIDGPQPTATVAGLGVLVSVGGESVGATTLYVQQGWDPATLRNDIALLALPRPVAARAIVLAALTRPRSPLAGGRGRGRMGGRRARRRVGAGLLYAATLPVNADAGCAADYPGGDGVTSYDPATMTCAGPGGGGAGTCFGDSGGPLMVPDGYGGSLLVGSTSWGGVPCASAGNPSVFTRLPAFAPGIVALLGGAAEGPAGAAVAATDPRAMSPGHRPPQRQVDPDGLATDFRIEVGSTTGYGTVVARGYAGAGHGPVAVSAPVTGLSPSVAYHYRVVAENAAGVAAGADAVLSPGAPAAAAAATPAGTAAGVAAASFAARTHRAPCYLHRGKRRTACLKRQRQLRALRACGKRHAPTLRARCRRAVLHRR